MALDDAYATAEEYRLRVKQTRKDDEPVLNSMLLAISRFLDWRLRRFFNQDSAVQTRLYDGNGETRLWLPDDIATSTGLIVTVDLDGDYDFSDETALVKDTDFWLGPANADLGPEARPWEFLDVHPNSANLSVWPEQQRAVQVKAKFGWAAVPGAIKEATIALTRQVYDVQQSGMTLTLQNIDAELRQSPQASFLIRDLERQYMKPPRF